MKKRPSEGFDWTSLRNKMPATQYPNAKNNSEWKKELTEEEFQCLRQAGTEAPGTGEYHTFFPKKGYFACRGCAAPLYSAEAKFQAGCGWPAFDLCYAGAVKTYIDHSHGMERIEIVCNRCDGHLGHVRRAAAPPPRPARDSAARAQVFVGEQFPGMRSSERHCVNSISVRYVKGEDPQVAEERVTEKL